MTVTIPYVKQPESSGGTSRTCGAACLSMVYASLGLKVSPDEIWPQISKRNQFGSLASTTHLMAKDAIARGFDAIIVQATYPLEVLSICEQRGIRVILNHRLSPESRAGHYSVLVGMDKANVILHDPLAGPNRMITVDQLMDLWRPPVTPSETIGNIVIGIALPPATRPLEQCRQCNLPIPEQAPCPKCKHPVSLRPSAILGCIAERCGSRYWSYVSCPECDCLWSFYGKPDVKAGAASAAKPAIDPSDVDQIYHHIEKFIAQVESIPAVVQNADVQKQIEFIRSQKEVLRMAQAESNSARRQQGEQMEALREMGAANQESLKKRREEAARQSPPLDGDALGMALLRNLGFMR